jgi:Domain of unknown function (DUF5127)/Domain of unknown function (DUF1793)
MTPALPDDLDLMSRPETYLTGVVQSKDGKQHSVSLYFDASGQLTVDSPAQDVVASRFKFGALTALLVGSQQQPILQKAVTLYGWTGAILCARSRHQIDATWLPRKEIAFYKTKQNSYGLPLDSRAQYTKLGWLLWTATRTDNGADFDALFSPVYKLANETPDRVPLSEISMRRTPGNIALFRRDPCRRKPLAPRDDLGWFLNGLGIGSWPAQKDNTIRELREW